MQKVEQCQGPRHLPGVCRAPSRRPAPRYSPAVLYFAYGSNLDPHNWEDWCLRRGFDTRSIEPLGPAWLPDHELVFHYRSRLRDGGALDIRPRRGTAIPGALFRVADWGGLDAKEGVSGRYYRRVGVVALTSDGDAHEAATYRVCSDRVRGFVPPGPEYRAIVERGLSRFGHGSEGFIAAAQGESAPPWPDTLFTYGTLMRGQQSHGRLDPYVRRAHGRAHVNGAAMLRIDWYPGLVLSPAGTVHGELFEIDGIEALLGELDAYEDFTGYGRNGSMYRRSLVSAVTPSGPRLAWTYVYVGEANPSMRIPSGRWTDP